MGLYIYTNEDETEYVEVVQGMNDDHSYIHTDGKQWRRVFQIPQASFDTKLDVWSPADFARKTATKRGTIGDLWSEAGEASAKRAGTTGQDPIKQKYLSEDYGKTRSGAEHPLIKKQRAETALKKVGISITSD
ncbi:MAG: hypothetical protein WC390_06560 [Sulfurimonas sp.]|jgi:hypothetical protein